MSYAQYGEKYGQAHTKVAVTGILCLMTSFKSGRIIFV